MKQLTGMDASFLYLETPNAPMHISGLSIYTQESAPGGKVRFKQIIETISTRIQRLPTLTRRLVTVPMGLDHPYWIDDGNFDPERYRDQSQVGSVKLIELKLSQGAKPGHGGILDRFDGLIFTLPFAHGLIYLVGRLL